MDYAGWAPLPEAIQQVARDANEYFDSHAKMNWQTLPHQIVPEYCLAYQAALLNDIQLMPQPRPYKVVVDGLYGSAGPCAVLVLKKLGSEVYALRCEANGEFLNMPPILSSQTFRSVASRRATAACWYRYCLWWWWWPCCIDWWKGVIISADRLLSLFAHMCLADHPAHEVVLMWNVPPWFEIPYWPIRVFQNDSHRQFFLRKYLAQSKGHAVLAVNMQGIMYLMMVVVLVMTMVYMPHYVCWNT